MLYHVYAEDMDADGDIDILASAAIGDKVVLFKSNGPQIQHLLLLISLPALIPQLV